MQWEQKFARHLASQPSLNRKANATGGNHAEFRYNPGDQRSYYEQFTEWERQSGGSPPPQEWALWELMTKIYGQRWIAKNGNRPSDLWAAQVNSMTSEQLTRVCSAFADKCRAGSHWPPDLAEFVAVTAECSGGSFGLTVDDVLAENKRWRNEFYRYSCAETFEWRHPVLYHICIALKRIGIERKLTERELRAQAAKELERWEKRVAGGLPIPPIRRQLESPKAPRGQRRQNCFMRSTNAKRGLFNTMKNRVKPEHKPMTNRVTAKQLVDIILGKEMSTTEIWEAVKAAHPANTMTRQELALRLRSMIRSPDVKITKKGCGPRALYKLTSVSDKFVERAEVNYRANPRTGTPDKTLWHFHPKELQFCNVHKMFDQALANLRGRRWP